MMRQNESNRIPSSGDAARVLGVTADTERRYSQSGNAAHQPNQAGYRPQPAPLSSETHIDVRDPMLAVLLDVQRGRIGSLTALYRVRALVAGGWT